MSTILATSPIAPVEPVGTEPPQHWPYRMSLDLYERIAELGLIRPEEHVVLLDGILVQAMTKGPEHSTTLLEGLFALHRIVPDGWHIRPEQPISLPNETAGDSSPEPDIAVVRGRNLDYRGRHPRPGEVGLIIEVASDAAALLADRRGLARYAFARIPTVWIVTLFDRRVHVHTEPTGPAAAPGYARVEVRHVGELLDATLPPLEGGAGAMPAVLGPLAVASFFPPVA